MQALSDLIDALITVNIKLYNLCDKKMDIAKNPAAYSKEDIVKLMSDDVALCEKRAGLRRSIDLTLRDSIMDISKLQVVNEVKQYGS